MNPSREVKRLLSLPPKKITPEEMNKEWVVAMKRLARIPKKTLSKDLILASLDSTKFDHVISALREYTVKEWQWFIDEQIPKARSEFVKKRVCPPKSPSRQVKDFLKIKQLTAQEVSQAWQEVEVDPVRFKSIINSRKAREKK